MSNWLNKSPKKSKKILFVGLYKGRLSYYLLTKSPFTQTNKQINKIYEIYTHTILHKMTYIHTTNRRIDTNNRTIHTN